jgi:hypothetical protein
MIKLWNNKVFQILLTACISVILLFVAQSLTEKSDKKRDIDKELQTKASIEYVDKQDLSVINYVKQHSEESERADNQLMNYIKSMDRKIDILLSKK